MSITKKTSSSAELETVVLRESVSLNANSVFRNRRFVVAASHIVIEGNGSTLIGPALKGDLESFEGVGAAILIEGCTNVVIRNLHAHGFETGIEMADCLACSIEGCDFSDNYDNPTFGWGELPARGGIIVRGCRYCVFNGNRATGVWDGIHLRDSDDNLILNNEFSHCSNVCAKLWNASRNVFIENNLSYGIRIDREAGEVHARDSSGVLMESGSNDNKWYRNDITHGGDGLFLRPLNHWVQRGNVFIENDTSYGNNNCIECWSPQNVFIRNKANHGSYGFWMGGSCQTLLIGNQANGNGLESGFHNAPEPLFKHGGIVLVGGSGTHVVVEGNECTDNNGGGIVFRGDVKSEGKDWKIQHWTVQDNRLENNRWTLFGRFADSIATDVKEGCDVEAIQNLTVLPGNPEARAPIARIEGPSVCRVGLPVRFSAASSLSPEGKPLSYEWLFNDERARGEVVDIAFKEPGTVRVGLTASDGEKVGLAWLDLTVVEEPFEELGTEAQVSLWRSNSPLCTLADDPDAMIGRFSVRFSALPLPEGLPEMAMPLTAGVLEGKSKLSFWVKSVNTNVFAFQRDEIVVCFRGPGGEVRYTPTERGKPSAPKNSEARWNWHWVEIDLRGDENWKKDGNGVLAGMTELAIAFDSTGQDRFTVWIDGISLR